MTILTKPKNLQSTMQTLMLLPDVDIVRLARDQGWWIPQFYPFIFPGQFRAGHRGLPPVLSNCTAHDQSLKLLKLFVRVEGRCDLPRNIVLVHEDLSRSFLPEAVLTPPAHIFNFQILPSVFSVVFGNQDQSDQSSSSVDQNQSDDDDDDNPGAGSQDNDSDGGGVVSQQPSRPQSQARAVMDLSNQARFYPGTDGYGALHIERRKFTVFRQPWQLRDEDFQICCRMTKVQFLEFEVSVRGSTLRMGSGLIPMSQCLLFHIKLCHDTPDEFLAQMFAISRSTTERVFYRIALYHFVNNSNIPNILSLEGQIVAAELNKLLSTAYRNTPDFMKQLLRDFKDPDPTRNRIGVPLNVDATYFHTTSSADIGKIIYFLEKPL